MRIPWSEYSGEDIEDCVAMLLCRENRLAQQRKPAQGDQGIDVITPSPQGVTVYQVKRFTQPLDNSQKRQIKKSWDRFVAHAREQSLQVVEWVCVRPRNASQPDEKWLAELTAGAGFPTRWMGLNQVNALAATYPEVIDWYLHADRDRIHRSVLDALTAMQLLHDPASPADLEPGPQMPRLQALARSVNRSDPHYWYAVHLEPPGPFLDPVSRPGLVMEVTIGSPTENVRVSVIARCAASVHERPISFTANLSLQRGSPEEVAVQDFLDYGVTMANVPAALASTTMPGGLTWDGLEEGFLTVGPSVDNDDPVTRDEIAEIRHPDGHVLARLELTMRQPTTGARLSEKVAREGQARHGGLAVQMRFDPEGQVQWRMQLSDMTGLQLEDAREVLTFVAEMREPNELHSRPRLRPDWNFWVPAAAPSAVLEASRRMQLAPTALIGLRDRLAVNLVMHSLDLITEDYLSDLVLIEEVVRVGEVTRPWQGADFVFAEDEYRRGETAEWATSTPVRLTTYRAAFVPSGKETIHLGTISIEGEVSLVAPAQPLPEGGWKITYRAAPGGTCTLRWLGPGHHELEGQLRLSALSESPAESD